MANGLPSLILTARLNAFSQPATEGPFRASAGAMQGAGR